METSREILTTSNRFGDGEVRSWASIIDQPTLDQAAAISRVPIVKGYLALMPDAHHGYGPPVGSALITEGVMPYAVGVDIGCGMIAVRTNLMRDDLRGHERAISGNIRKRIPGGNGPGAQHEVDPDAWPRFLDMFGMPPGIGHIRQTAPQTAARQFGTLGGGNHFVEVCVDTSATVWLLLHSGSRGVGNQLAEYHVKEAQALCELRGLPLENKEFAYFLPDDPQYIAYLADMIWAQAYAYWQREAMMDALIKAVWEEVCENEMRIVEQERINCHHNYAEVAGDGMLLTRKGAIDASNGTLGIIPGSMGAATYIVRGRGNAEAYNTSPHGAGRYLSRGQAKRTLSSEEFKEQMGDRVWQDRDAQALLDEAPGAYKPIETVIADSASLIEPVTVLSQIINYKGV